MAGCGEFDQTLRDEVVEVADQSGQLARAHALGEQVAHQPADVGGDHGQRGDIAGGTCGRADLLDRELVQRVEVALGDDADDAPALGHRHVAHAALRHQQHRVLRGMRHTQRVHRLRHDALDRRVQRQLRKRDAAEQVVAGQDAQRRAGGVGDQHRADGPLVHLLQGRAQRRLRRDGRRRPHDEPAQRRLHRLLGQGLRGESRLQRAPRDLEQRRDARVEVVGQRCRLGREFAQQCHRHAQAQAVHVGGVGRGDRALAQRRADRKQVGRVDLEARRRLAAAPAADAAAAQPPDLSDDAVGRRDDDLAGAVGHGLGRADEALDLRQQHPRERRVLHQLGDEPGVRAGRQRLHAARIRKTGSLGPRFGHEKTGPLGPRFGSRWCGQARAGFRSG